MENTMENTYFKKLFDKICPEPHGNNLNSKPRAWPVALLKSQYCSPLSLLLNSRK